MVPQVPQACAEKVVQLALQAVLLERKAVLGLQATLGQPVLVATWAQQVQV